MVSNATTPQEYIEQLPDDRKEAIKRLREVIIAHLPEGFTEGMGYGMIGYAVPHSIYPAGYHCNPKLPLPFLSFASQKNSINIYHMGLYAKKELYDWFISEFPKHSKKKLDIGKSCMRFKKEEDIPFDLIAELVTKMSVQDWISCYEMNFKK
ncbi:MAG: DUF1801 domain-containing protein [Flavobacterium sp.]|jgi:uncharacterized protein YdhG (YjbR/CyaY superfamily)